MKVQFEGTEKRKKAAAVGDIIQYQLSDGEVVNGIIISVPNGEYAMLNLETHICGIVKRYSPNELVKEYSDQNNFVLYRKCEWDATLTIKPKYEVYE